MKIKSTRKNLAIPYLIYMGIFILLPLALVVIYAFSLNNHFSFTPTITFFQSQGRMQVLFVSLIFGFMNTLVCLLIGYPLAYFLADKKINKNVVLVMLFVMPMWINFVIRTWALRDVLNFIGLGGGNYPELATIIGLAYNYLPFTILPLYTTMLRLDRSQIEASYDLGAGPVRTFVKVIFPMTLPGVVSAAIMVFMPTMTSYVISDIMGEGKITLFGKYIEIYFTQNQLHDGSFLALLMLVLISLTMFISKTFDKSNKKGDKQVW